MLSRLLILLFSVNGLSHAATLSDWLAQSKPRTQDQLVTPQHYPQFMKAQRYIEQKNSAGALQILNSFNNSDLNPTEQAIKQQYLAYAYTKQNENNSAIQALQQALTAPHFSKQEKLTMATDLAALYVKTQQYAQAADLQQQLFKYRKPNEASRRQTAALFYQAQQCQRSLAVLKPLKIVQPSLKDEVVQIKLACYQQLKRYPQQAELIESLLAQNAQNADLWEQLIASYQQAKQYNKALASLLSAHQLGFYQSSQDIYRIADFYRYLEQPINAARFLQQALMQNKIKKNQSYWRYLSDCYIDAKQRDMAIDALQQQDASRAKIALEIAALYQQQDDWQGVLVALQQVKYSEQEQEQYQVYLLQGNALYFLNQPEQAQQYFSKAASSSDNNIQQQATQWLAYLKQVEHIGQQP